jgi:hypothetical protein
VTLPVNIALADETANYSLGELSQIAAALNQQIADLRKEWEHIPPATVEIPYQINPHQWSIKILNRLNEPGALGYHTDDNATPVAYVMFTSKDETPQTISHETAEMLADPLGSLKHGGQLPSGMDLDYRKFGLPSPHHHVYYLREICDPPEATSYQVAGINMSDFVLPSWYRTNPKLNAAYSFAGTCVSPREVAEGGYVSFCNDAGEWYQIFVQGGRPEISDLGKFDKSRFGSLREFTDHHAREFRA